MTDRKAFLVPHGLHILGAGLETASHVLSNEKDLKKDVRMAGATIGLLAAVIELIMVFGQKNADNSGHKAMAATKAGLTIIKFCLAIAEYYTPEDTKESKAKAHNLRQWHKGFTAAHSVFAVGHAAFDIYTLSATKKDNTEKLPMPEESFHPCAMVP